MANRLRILLLLAAVLMPSLLLLGCGDDDDNGGNGPVVPAGLATPNGTYYTGSMGDSALSPELVFAVRDAGGNNLPNQQVQLDLLEGDGELSGRSVVSGSDGLAHSWYRFNGSLGHAIIRATARNGADTADVQVRASALIPGDHGQGQYVLFDDTYADVLNFNGPPASVDTYDDHDWMYANYEAALGVVVMLYDPDRDRKVYDTSSVLGIIVNTIYTDTTAEGIGLGAHQTQVAAAYGSTALIPDDEDVRMDYDTLGLSFYLDTASFQVFEIHLREPTLQTVGAGNATAGRVPATSTRAQTYRRHGF